NAPGCSRIDAQFCHALRADGSRMEVNQLYRYIAFIVIAWFSGLECALAQGCAVDVHPYQLNLDHVVWSMKVASGRSCVWGFRVSGVVLESVRLAIAPETGQVTIKGVGFSYQPKIGFLGADSFTVVVSGTRQRTMGTSTIRVLVSVVEPGKPGTP